MCFSDIKTLHIINLRLLWSNTCIHAFLTNEKLLDLSWSSLLWQASPCWKKALPFPPPFPAFRTPPKGPFPFPSLQPLQPSSFIVVAPPGCWQTGGVRHKTPVLLHVSWLALPSSCTGFPLGYIQERATSGCWKPCQDKKAATITLASGLPVENKPWQHVTSFLEHLRSAGFSYRKLPVLCVEPGLGCFSSQICSASGHRWLHCH